MSALTSYANTLYSTFYLLTLVGGVNWLVTGVRLLYPAESGSGEQTLTLIPDALSWGGETFQIAVYYLVGVSSVCLFLLSLYGYWLRKGEALVSCERVAV
tara:strand:+ start:3427 stop:3726 length:300 start_codon:yes stop_codon:yes gene_type:complete